MMNFDLPKGMRTTIDVESLPIIHGYHWYVHKETDNLSYVWARKANGKYIKMHRLIMGLTEVDSIHVDHVNGDGLDNRKCNLRLVTHQQNIFNSKARPGTSEYKGVCWDKVNKKWQAQIMKNGKSYKIGRFSDEKKAARLYDKAALKHFGEHAWLNCPSGKYIP